LTRLLLILIEEKRAAAAGQRSRTVRLRSCRSKQRAAILPRGLSRRGRQARGAEAAWLHELGVESARRLVEPLAMEGQAAAW